MFARFSSVDLLPGVQGSSGGEMSRGTVELCLNIHSLPMASQNPVIFLFEQHQYMQLNMAFCDSGLLFKKCILYVCVCMSTHVVSHTCLCAFVVQRSVLNCIYLFSASYILRQCAGQVGFFFSYQFDTIWSLLGRGNVNCENATIIFACKQACGIFP